MPVTKVDLQVYQGADYAATVTVEYIDGTAVDLTGWSAKAQLRNGSADCNPEIIHEITTTISLPDQVILSIPHYATSTLKGRYAWDLDLTSPDDAIVTVLAGNANVTAEITR